MINPHLLLVEGPRDEEVFDQIIRSEGDRFRISISAAGGYQSLRSQLRVILKPGTDIERLAVVIDADTNLSSRWESISSAIRSAGYASVPRQPDTSGLVLEAADLPRVGVWIMPNNRLPGKLEDFLTMLVPESDTLIDRARLAVKEIPAESRLFAEVHEIKAVIHTWLAWQKEPGTPLSLAITRKYFPTDGPLVGEFIAWLNRVFA